MWPFRSRIERLKAKLESLKASSEYWRKEHTRLGWVVYNFGNDEMFLDPFKWARLQGAANAADNRRRECDKEIQKVINQLADIRASAEVLST